jgi:hypothetical protein
MRLWSGATLVLLAACTAPGATSSPSASAQAPILVLRAVDAEPARREEAGIRLAFDAASAAELVVAVPPEVDFATDALLCVYLGERPTAGWGLDLQTASLAAGELRVLARETRPRGTVEQVVTYPAGCGVLNRAALPPGELAVRADDTISSSPPTLCWYRNPERRRRIAST